MLLVNHEVSNFAFPCPSAMMFFLTTDAETTGLVDHALKPLKP
jgi:hypothetical protein